MKARKHLVLFTLFAMNLVDQPAPHVKIHQGIVSGKVSTCGSYLEYIGIPYASTSQATRFQAPQPPPHWEGIFKATDDIYHCPQNTPIGVIGIEDCLKINVYVPAVAHRPLPVMVYVHGGAFILGSGGKLVYAPDFLIQHEVIVVTFNYRLGALGFLCLGTNEAPGNAGLKDQVSALRWVKKNIAAFGGDSDNVTIFGHSAGGVSVSLLVASKMTDGLFERAIVVSGSSLAYWAINNDPVRIARQTANLFGLVSEDPKQVYELFSKMPYKDLIGATAAIPIGKQLLEKTLHLPCVEKKHSGIEAFLTDLPYNLLLETSKNISLMYGSTDKEGLFLAAEETEKTLKIKNENKLFSDDLVFKSKEEELDVAQELKKYYFGSEDIDAKTLMNLSQFYTDMVFEMPLLLEAEIMSQRLDEKPFIYHFTYSGGRNMLKYHYGFADEPGACHGDDILYIFKGIVWPFKIKKEDAKVKDWITQLITNFAKYGHPTPHSHDLPVQWLPSNKDELRLLYIDNELKMGSIPQPDAFRFWKNLYTKYRRL